MESININKVLRTNPSLALTIPNIEEEALKLLPYSIGIEIECDNAPSYKKSYFDEIPDLMENDSGHGELRFRIPSGIKGLICLYRIAELTTQHCLPSESGIHYHVDFSDEVVTKDGLKSYYDLCTHSEFVEENKEFVLQELDKWNYRGSYNSREMNYNHSWVRFQSGFKTFEFRIGEMTFDYELLTERIFHISLICNLLKDKALLHNQGVFVNVLAEKQVIEDTINSRIVNIYDEAGSVEEGEEIITHSF